MSSSTSSSESSRPAPRGPYVRVLLVVLLGMGVSMGLVRAFTAANDASAETIIERVSQARAQLPRIVATEGDLTMLFGSSLTAAGFSPRHFDRRLAEQGIEVTSFNFGFGGLNPYFQDYFSRRIRDTFLDNDRRLKLALVEFTPLQNTKARWNGAQPLVDSYVAMLASGDDVLEILADDLTRGIRVAQIKYLRNEISAEMVTWYFGRQIYGNPSRPGAGVAPDEVKEALLEELGPRLTEAFNADYPDYDGCDWCWEWRGGGTIPEDRSPETVQLIQRYYAALRSEQRLSDDRQWRIVSADAEQLRFEETLVAAFIRTVGNFKQFADHVEVVLLPRNPTWIRRPPEAEQRLAAVLQRIQQETGVAVRDFEDAPGFGAEMFGDTTHLARYSGDVRFTDLLADTYAPLLGTPRSQPGN